MKWRIYLIAFLIFSGLSFAVASGGNSASSKEYVYQSFLDKNGRVIEITKHGNILSYFGGHIGHEVFICPPDHEFVCLDTESHMVFAFPRAGDDTRQEWEFRGSRYKILRTIEQMYNGQMQTFSIVFVDNKNGYPHQMVYNRESGLIAILDVKMNGDWVHGIHADFWFPTNVFFAKGEAFGKVELR